MTIAWNIRQLVNDYEYTSSGHFFKPDTMRFFASRLTNLYKRIDDLTRVYNLRKATLYKNDNGFNKVKIESIDTYSSRYLANKALKGML